MTQKRPSSDRSAAAPFLVRSAPSRPPSLAGTVVYTICNIGRQTLVLESGGSTMLIDGT